MKLFYNGQEYQLKSIIPMPANYFALMSVDKDRYEIANSIGLAHLERQNRTEISGNEATTVDYDLDTQLIPLISTVQDGVHLATDEMEYVGVCHKEDAEDFYEDYLQSNKSLVKA